VLLGSRAVSNKDMASSQSQRVGLNLAAVCLAGAVFVGMSWLVRARFTHPKITDQTLLREAVEDWKRAGEPGMGPNPQIFEQQAGQGYYEDAAATGRLFKSTDDVQWSIVELAKIRAENGDVPGAKAAIRRFAGTSLGERGIRNIANVQAHKGDLDGALATASEIKGEDDVWMVFAGRQIDAGDFDGALKTSERMSLNVANQLFYDVGDGLRLRHQQIKVKELASHMRNPKYAADFKRNVRFTLWDPVPMRTVQAAPCDLAVMYAGEGKFSLADRAIEQNKCTYVTFVAVQQYAADPVGAERLLRTTTNRDYLRSGLYQFAIAAADKGNVAEALRFLNSLESLDPHPVGGTAVQAIARAWTIQAGPQAVIQWARSRFTLDQKTSALIGMAEALGHARPCQVGVCTR
jgi:hypothetical protein